MNKFLRTKWPFLVFGIMISFFTFSVIYWIINVGVPFDESWKLYFLMKDLHIPIWITIFLMIFLVLTPILFLNIFKRSWIKLWKSFIPIYNIYVLLWIIGVRKCMFSLILVCIPMHIILLFLAWFLACQCACGYSELKSKQIWYMPMYCWYNTPNWFFEFISDVFLLFMTLYLIWFIIFLCYSLFKYCFVQKKILYGKSS